MRKTPPSKNAGTACRITTYDVWAWVELNYRPHAYQAEDERWRVPDTAHFVA